LAIRVGKKNASTCAITSFFGVMNPYKNTIVVFGGFGHIYLQGLHTLVNLQECLALEVNFTPKHLCIVSFSIFFGGRSVANHGYKDHGPSCFAKSCINNNGFC
jgi:hypothetical protein